MNSYQKQKDYLKRDINNIVTWLWEEHDVHVDFDHETDNEYDDDTKIISINSKLNYRVQLHTLIHELGHFILAQDKRKFNSLFPFYKKESRTSKGIRIDTIREEVYAWDKGLEAVNQLGIRVNKTSFHKYIKNALWSYVTWAVNPGFKKRKRIKKK